MLTTVEGAENIAGVSFVYVYYTISSVTGISIYNLHRFFV
jgi:hypothetical protein